MSTTESYREWWKGKLKLHICLCGWSCVHPGKKTCHRGIKLIGQRTTANVSGQRVANNTSLQRCLMMFHFYTNNSLASRIQAGPSHFCMTCISASRQSSTDVRGQETPLPSLLCEIMWHFSTLLQSHTGFFPNSSSLNPTEENSLLRCQIWSSTSSLVP